MKYLIISILLVQIYSDIYSKVLDRDEVRNSIIASLIINYYDQEIQNCFSIHQSSFVLDTMCFYDIEFKKVDSLNFPLNNNLVFYEYDFPFKYNCYNSRIVSDTTIKIEILKRESYELKFDFKKRDSIDLQGELMQMFKSVNQLHRKGLIAEDTLRKRIIHLSGTSLTGLFFERDYFKKIDLLLAKELIQIKYYNYTPQDINIDVKNLSFNFYSDALNRRLIGTIKYSDLEEFYFLELVNGILIEN